MKTSPRKLIGPWREGYALDLHTISSVFLGYNQFGKEVYESTRSPLGELVFRLKYRNDESVLPQIVDTAAEFLRTWRSTRRR